MQMTRFPPVAALPLAGLMILITSACSAHGVRCVRLEGAIGIRAEYDNGEPIASAAVTVYEPGNDEQPWLSGTTDEKGSFFFVPNANGDWTVRIKDDQGHATSEVFSIGNHLAEEEREEPTKQQSPMQFIVAMAIIFGLFGVFSLLRRR